MSAGAGWAFVRNYVLKRGLLLGSAGFIVSALNTHYTFAKLAKLRELEQTARDPAMSPSVLHVDTAASWRGGQNQVLLTRARNGRARRAQRDRLPPRRRARGAGRRRGRAAAPAAVPRRPVAAGDPGPRPPAAPRALRGAAAPRPARGDRGAAGRAAGRLPAAPVAVRRVDFALRSPLSRAKYAACDRVIVVSRAIGGVMERCGIPGATAAARLRGRPGPHSAAPEAREAAARARRAGGRAGGRQRRGAHRPQGPRDADRGHGPACASALPQARLVIAGEGELRAALEAQVRELRARATACVFAGFRARPRPAAARVLACSACPRGSRGSAPRCSTRWRSACRSWRTAAGGIPEAVEDGVSGRVVPVARPGRTRRRRSSRCSATTRSAPRFGGRRPAAASSSTSRPSAWSSGTLRVLEEAA